MNSASKPPKRPQHQHENSAAKTAEDLDLCDLYELCVQSPHDAARLLRAIHGRSPTILAEDFAGTAAVSKAWVQQDPNAHAIATDLDAHALARTADKEPRITAVIRDLKTGPGSTDAEQQSADVVYVGNFSIGYFHTRAELLDYLRRAHRQLSPRNGVFVCDTYGGESAYMLGTVDKTVPLPSSPNLPGPRGHIIYTWEQRAADPTTAMVTDVLHFNVFKGNERIAQHRDAYVYNWRLWTIPELREAMHEAGFKSSSVYQQLPDAIDDAGNAYVEPISDGQAELDDNYIVCIAGKTGSD